MLAAMRIPVLQRMLAAALVLAAFCAGARADNATEGRDLAQRLCASCHAIGSADRSPIPTAPAFQRLEPRVDLAAMTERLEEGILAGHPEMPVFKLRPHEARALVTYLRAIQSDRPR